MRNRILALTAALAAALAASLSGVAMASGAATPASTGSASQARTLPGRSSPVLTLADGGNGQCAELCSTPG